MNTSRLILGATILCALPVCAQPDIIPPVGGNALCLLPIKYEHWEIKNVLDARESSHEFVCGTQKIRITVSHAILSDKNLKLRIGMALPDTSGKNAKAFFPFSIVQLLHVIRLKDVRGFEMSPMDYDWRWTTVDGRTMIQSNFAILGETGQNPDHPTTLKINRPISFSVDLPTEVIQTELPFSFSDTPLP